MNSFDSAELIFDASFRPTIEFHVIQGSLSRVQLGFESSGGVIITIIFSGLALRGWNISSSKETIRSSNANNGRI